MLKDLVAAKPLTPYQIYLRFEDGVEGTIDLSQLIDFSGIFTLLQDPAYFATVKVHPELGTIVWDNGADLDPVVLYSLISGQPLPNYENRSAISS